MKKLWQILVISSFLSMGIYAYSQDQQSVTNKPVQNENKVQSQEPALSNTDIIKMVKLGLGETIVVAKILEANAVSFSLAINDLDQLQKEGVPQSVIAAMLQRNTNEAKTASKEREVISQAKKEGPVSLGEVMLCSPNGDKKIPSVSGSHSSTFAYVTTLLYMDYPGVKADARISDKRPSFLIGSKESPAGRYYLVKTDPNQGDKLRSVKMGKMGRFTTKQVGKPDSDWTFECEIKNEQPGVWRLTPKEELKVGEYGIWASPVGDLFDFGIDG
jgi:hypothetical protein